MTKHRQELWEWEEGGCLVAYNPKERALGGSYVVRVVLQLQQGQLQQGEYYHGPPEESDMSLVAASPDLLAACEAHAEVATHRRTCHRCTQDHHCLCALDLLRQAWQITKPALEKVKGSNG